MQAIEPYNLFKVWAKSDTLDVPTDYGAVRAIYVGGTGDLALMMANGDIQLMSAVPVGTILPIAPRRIMSTNTSASLFLILYRQ